MTIGDIVEMILQDVLKAVMGDQEGLCLIQVIFDT